MTRLLGARYEVQELIGAGGMADVYRGYDNRLHRVVAIKILRADLARDPSLQSRARLKRLRALIIPTLFPCMTLARNNKNGERFRT
jgi:serine/threonine protein kinase